MKRTGKQYYEGWRVLNILPHHYGEGTPMKMGEVREKAKALGLKKTFGLSKAELIRRIQRAEGNFDCFGTAKGYCDQLDCCFREDSIKPKDQ
jgi:hypothetical protein